MGSMKMNLKHLANGIQYKAMKHLSFVWIHVVNFNECNVNTVCVYSGFRIMVFRYFGCLTLLWIFEHENYYVND